MANPYQDLDPKAFWAPSVGKRDPLEISDLWVPKWPIRPQLKIATFGSCFAQHFGRALARKGYRWFDAEPAPAGLSEELAKSFNYGVFSARTGNIYTVSLLRQWVEWALGKKPVPTDEIWEKDGRFYDPFRPNVEPNGFASHEEMLASRELTIEAFGKAVREANVFVFTLGLTESWWNKTSGYEYPMCPGTVSGTFDPDQHEFVNQNYSFIETNLRAAIQLIRSVNPRVRVLLTVSPVPLTATMSGKHVLVATMQSKSILRSVAGAVAEASPSVDYFPSYEIIASPPFGGRFYASNKRQVEQEGVDFVMSNFFACMYSTFPALARGEGVARKTRPEAPVDVQDDDSDADIEDVVCEEELLAAFAPGKG